MFAVARHVQNNTKHTPTTPNTSQQASLSNSSKPKFLVRPRFLVSDSKTTFLEAQKVDNQIKEKKKIKFRLSIIKDCRNLKGSNNQIFGKKTKKSKDSSNKGKSIRRREGSFHCGRWQPDEHQRFIEAILKYGNEWKEVQKHVGTRSSTQARSHAQKFFVKIKRSNLFDFNVDFSKNSIKTLHNLAGNLSSEEYCNAIKVLNCVAFERKAGLRRRLGRKDDLMSTDSFMNEVNSTMNTHTIGFR
jgi:SHAQKYF class myb-like DNA-binding protein